MDEEKSLTLIKLMLKMQNGLNSVVNEEWEKAGFAWNRAIWLESAELVESLPWKWWKHTEPDIKNARVEVVDIWHFVMSSEIVKYGFANIENIANVLYQQIFSKLNDKSVFDSENLIKNTEKLAMYASDNTIALYPMSQVIKHAGFNLESLYREYMIKNILNRFRQENGYKDGSYIKQWVWMGATAEDNLCVGSLAEHIELDENFGLNLKEAMEEEYKKNSRKT